MDSYGFWVWKCQCPKFSFSILCDLCSVPAKIEFYIHCQWSKSASMPLNTEWHTMTHRTTSAWSSLALVFWLRFGQVVPQDMSFLVLRIGCSTSSRDSRHKKWFGKARCLQMSPDDQVRSSVRFFPNQSDLQKRKLRKCCRCSCHPDSTLQLGVSTHELQSSWRKSDSSIASAQTNPWPHTDSYQSKSV